jgi:hypothetical protein
MGDKLVIQNNTPVAAELACPGGTPVLLQAGCDYDTLAIGLDQHVAATPAERLAILQATPQAYDTLRQNGALVLAGYLPRWTVANLTSLKFDGVENYNPLFNFKGPAANAALGYVLALGNNPSSVADPEIGLIAFFQEDATTQSYWSQMVQVARVPSFIGSNAHENVFPNLACDGERLDSYRRMLHWWSNYVMLPQGTALSTTALKQAIAAGHTFAAFDYLGYPTGFDFHAESGGTTYEQGDQVPPGGTTNLVVVAPTVYGLTPMDQAPQIRVRILQAMGTTWNEIASGTGTVTAMAVPTGVYRAEARIIPNQLTPHLGPMASQYLTEKVWVYGNTIWVGTNF